MSILQISNHGPLITRTNYWGSEHERAGKIIASVNAGAVRLLIPRKHAEIIGDLRTAKQVIISRGPWPAERVDDAVELLFDDGTLNPFAFHLSANSFADFLPGPPKPGQEWIVSVWVQKKMKPHKALERPAKWRRVDKLPDLSSWSEPN